MKGYIILFLMILPLSFGATTIDQFTADFNAGTLTNVNVTSNTVILAQTGINYVPSGTFLSSVKDLGSNPVATISWSSISPSATSTLISSRSGPTFIPGGTWSSWSSSYPNTAGSLVTAPTNRYHQYRVQLATTNAANTPTLQAVTYTYTEQGPTVTKGSSSSNLTESLSGGYRFYTQATDTVSVASMQAQYAYGTNGSYSLLSTMIVSGAEYYVDVPAVNWSAYENQNLRLRVIANSTTGASSTTVLTELIDIINTPPTLNPIANTTATEKSQRQIFISGFDSDNDAITFYTTKGSIQLISGTSAYIVWTPSNIETGLQNVTATLSDGYVNVSRTFTVNVTEVNDAPVIVSVSNQSGYYKDRITFDITVTDNDTAENLTFWVQPNIFDVELVNSSGTTYIGRADFIAFDDHKGFTPLTFYVSDGEASDSITSSLTINYCGDGVCQTGESGDLCSADCTPPQAAASHLAIEIPDRLCVNESFQITTYNASTRFVCYYEGKTHNFQSYCSEKGGVSITLYSVNNSKRTQVATLTSSAQGTINYTPTKVGTYTLIAEATDMISTSQIITVGACVEDISQSARVVRYEVPKLELDTTIGKEGPQIERPELTIEESSLLSIIIWYLFIPLLLAGLLYTGNAYYDIHKDTDPRILSLRIRLTLLQQKYGPQILSVWSKIWDPLAPYLVPPAQMLWTKIRPLLKPLLAKFKKSFPPKISK